MDKLLIKNVELLDTPNNELFNIAIEGNRIVSVGKDVPAEFTTGKIIDGKGKLATPGMVNTHNHVSMTILRSYADDLLLDEWLNKHIWPAEALMTADDMYWGAMLGIAEMLKTGTTAFADMYFNMDRIADACAALGIRANICPCFIVFRPRAEEEIEEGVELFKHWHEYDNGRIKITFGPHAPYTCSDEYLKKVITAAKKNKVELQMHLCETQFEVDGSLKDYGMTPIERMDKLGLLDCGVIASHCVVLNDNDRKIMAAKGVRVAHNPQSNLKLASGVADVPEMQAAGITVGLGTDGCSSNNNMDLLEEIRLAAMLHKGIKHDPLAISAANAWKMATKDGAKVLGFADLGELKAGQLADIVLWDMSDAAWCPRHNKLSLLVYSASSRDVDTVIVNGKLVVENRRLLTFDEDKIKAEVNKHTEALLARIKAAK